MLKQRVLNQIEVQGDLSDEELKNIIEQTVVQESRKTYISLELKSYLCRRLFDSLRRLDVLSELLDDEEITEIMVNGPNHIFIEKHGHMSDSGKCFSSPDKLNDVIQSIVGKVNRRVNESMPIADARLENGARVNIVLQNIAINGPAVTIRMFPQTPISMDQLVAWGTISREAAEYLSVLVKAGYNMFISGGTSSGKTTFLEALAGYIPKEERIITIEDSAELQLPFLPNLVRLEARMDVRDQSLQVSIRDLIRTALRMKPSRIIVGEVRGGEALDMLQAMSTGHAGSMSTGHGNNPVDMLQRIEMMVCMGIELPISAVRRQIASSIDILVHVGRLRDGSRKVLQIQQVMGIQNGEIVTENLFEFHETGEMEGRVIGKMVFTKKELARREQLEAAGLTLPEFS
ncbi:MAG: CpaF family protein [Lachnospiraceae bacterium]